MEFENKVALITGASVGIGRATALLLAEEGARLVLLDLDYERLFSVKEELAKHTEDVLIYACDVSDEARVHEVVADAISHFGRVDILVNNAAIWRVFSDFVETPTSVWKKLLDVNVMGTVYVTQAVLPSMIENHYGRIVNVSSVAGVYGNKRMTPYSATKGAVIAFTQALAKEVIEDGIVVNTVSPGTVTPSENRDVYFTEPSTLSHSGRTGSNRENAELICFLASDRAPYVAGQNIQIDGCRSKI